MIYTYVSDKTPTYNSLKVEMQIRSTLQHAWSTAVEIVGTFTRQALKSSQGEEDWLRFFELMGTALAHFENSPAVPNTPTDKAALRGELEKIAYRLDAVRRLRSYGMAPNILEDQDAKGNHFFLLQLDTATNRLSIQGYKSTALTEASSAYLEAEKNIANSSTKDAVLVSVDNLAALRRAYPNYFLDTNFFVDLVEDALKGNF